MSRKPLSTRFVITATLLGNTLEWYDFATFGFLVPIFAKLFFPPEAKPWLALTHTMLIFVCGTLLRPIGGLIFGFIGDRFGRKTALLSSILFMTLPTLVIGLTPTYWQIGIGATIILSLMRCLQGVAAGGEFPGAVTFLTESSPVHKKAFFGSFAYFGVALGVFLGGLDFYLVGVHFSEKAFMMWGWRLMYLLGALLGCIAFLLRRKLHETPVYQGVRETHETLRDPVIALFNNYKKAIGRLIGIEILETLAFNLIVSFSILYLTNILKIPFVQAVGLNMLCLFFLTLTIPLAGKLASKIGPRTQALGTAWAFLLFSFPLYYLSLIPEWRIFTMIGLVLLLAFYMGSMPALYSQLFPAKVRFSGIGFGYNLTVGIIGGFTPLAAYLLIIKTGFILMPAIFLMLGAIISIIILHFFIREKPNY